MPELNDTSTTKLEFGDLQSIIRQSRDEIEHK